MPQPKAYEAKLNEYITGVLILNRTIYYYLLRMLWCAGLSLREEERRIRVDEENE
jgi:hypothetical protein